MVRENKSEWEGYTTVGTEEVTDNIIEDFKDGLLVLDDMGSKLNKKLTLILQEVEVLIFE